MTVPDVDKIDSSYYESGAGYVLPKEIKNRTWELQFRSKLIKAKLPATKIDVLVLRFVYDMKLGDIATEMGFVSHSSVLRMITESLDYLKKVGFSK